MTSSRGLKAGDSLDRRSMSRTGKDIQSRVHIAIMDITAITAYPLPYSKAALLLGHRCSRFAALLGVGAALTLTACGQKGALYLPDRNPQVITTPAAPPGPAQPSPSQSSPAPPAPQSSAGQPTPAESVTAAPTPGTPAPPKPTDKDQHTQPPR